MEPKIAEQFQYRWIILLGSFMIRTIVFGSLFSVGVVYVEWLNEFGAGKGDTAWIGSLATGSCLLAGPLGGALLSRFDSRHVTFWAGVVMAIGLTSSIFAPNIYYLYVSYGIMSGFAGGVANITAVVIVVQYFDRQRALAMGIGSSGVGLGAFIFSVLQQKLMNEYGWRGSMAIVGAITANICVFGMMSITPEQLMLNKLLGNWRKKIKLTDASTGVTLVDLESNGSETKEIIFHEESSVEFGDKNESSVDSSDRNECSDEYKNENKIMLKNSNIARMNRRRSTFKKIKDKLRFTETTINLWRDPMFLLLFVSDFASWMVQFVPYVHLPQRSLALGVSPEQGALLVSVMGLMGAIGKTTFGGMCTFLRLEPYKVFTVAQILFGITTVLSPLCRSFNTLMIFAVSFGFLSGAYALMLVIPADVLGEEKFSAAYGLLLAGEGVGVYLGPPIVGWLSDFNDSYDFSFYCAGAVLLFSGLILLIRPLIEKKTSATKSAWKK